MPIVVDANLVVALAVDDDRAPQVSALLSQWLHAGVGLHAPSLLAYEVANGLTRLVAARRFPADRVAAAWQAVLEVPLTYHPLDEQGSLTIRLALQLQRTSAYDAAYLALAQWLDAELWTFDGPLARNATGLGFPVHLIR